MSIIRGTRNVANARKFYDWALGPEAQKLGYTRGGQLQMPSKRHPAAAGRADLSKIKLVEYNFVKYGQAAERRRLSRSGMPRSVSLPR